MGKKRIKQYLMLLLAIGVVSIAAGGNGTFASFSAEVTNSGNTFATGSLILNDTHGTTTCTSAVNNQTVTNNQNSSGTDCATLFNNVTFSPAHAVAAGTSGQSQITLSSLSGTIYNGDSLTITPTSGSPFNVTAANTTPVSANGTLTLSASLSSSFSGATVVDNSPTAFADVALQNAGTINANDVTVTPTSCTSSYGEGAGTLHTAGVINTTVTTIQVDGISGSFSANDPVIVSNGTDAQTFIVASYNSGTSTITVSGSPKWNANYSTSSTVSGPQFHGANAQSICGLLKLSIVEESANGNDPLFGNAISGGCVYGSASPNPAATNACDLTQGTVLTSTATTTLGGTLNAGATRYFELAVHVNGTGFDNTYQNTKTSAFSLTWHIDQ